MTLSPDTTTTTGPPVSLTCTFVNTLATGGMNLAANPTDLKYVTASAATKTYQFAQDLTAETAAKTSQALSKTYTVANEVSVWVENQLVTGSHGVAIAGKVVASPLTGADVNRNAVPGYDEPLARQDVLKDIPAGAPERMGFFLKGKPSVDGMPASAVFDIRHNYRTPPVLNALPHSPYIKMGEGENATDVRTCFNEAPSEFIGELKSSKSIDLFVHGFNVSSSESLNLRSRYVGNLRRVKYKNVNAGVSWSGDVGNNLASKALYFNRATRSADMSWEGVAQTVDFFRGINPDIKVDPTTHSLGARLVLDAAANGVKFNTVVLIVPAVDADAFSHGGKYEKAIQNISHLVVVYSRNQEVIFGVYRLAQFSRAMGDVGPVGQVNHPDFKAIDATDAWRNRYGMEINSHSDIYGPATIRMLVDQRRRNQ